MSPGVSVTEIVVAIAALTPWALIVGVCFAKFGPRLCKRGPPVREVDGVALRQALEAKKVLTSWWKKTSDQ